MHCPIPPIPAPDGFPFSQSPSDVDQPQVFDVDVYIGFWLDGVELYHDMRDVDPDGAQILIYYNPELDVFPEPQRTRIIKTYPPHNQHVVEILVCCTPSCQMHLDKVFKRYLTGNCTCSTGLLNLS